LSLSFSPAHSVRSPLVVLSDRRPARGAPRTGLESAIERALREHDGVWMVRRAETGAELGPGDPDDRWSVLDGARPPSMDDWAGYVRANASYAERIIEVIDPGGTVWIHGQRWLLVASALRGYGHRGPIGLSLDVLFPPPVRLEPLPWYADVMGALCQLDLLGLRSPQCADHFDACHARAGRIRPRIEVVPDGAASTEWTTSFLALLDTVARRELRRELEEPA
jgi:hypothetical protein